MKNATEYFKRMGSTGMVGVTGLKGWGMPISLLSIVVQRG